MPDSTVDGLLRTGASAPAAAASTARWYGAHSVPCRLRVPRILLPLLLCLSLIAGAVGSVWSATAMAMPADTAAGAHRDMDHACCHDGGGMHDAAKQPQPPASPCGDGKHCDCTQHCNMLPTLAASPASEIARSPEPAAPAPARYDVRPAKLNRPPIA